MLQGNPFETKLTVDERTSSVQRGASQQKTTDAANHDSRWQSPSMLSDFGFDGLSDSLLQAVKASWWLPAGLVIGVLLISILGG